MNDGEHVADVVPIHKDRDLKDDDRLLKSDRAREQDSDERRNPCWHSRYELDDEKRRVFCRDCGREVDAYKVLDDLAHDTERWIASRREAERRGRIAQENLTDLERREKNAKARLRRLKKRYEDDIVVAIRAAQPHIDRGTEAGQHAYRLVYRALTRYDRDWQAADDVSDTIGRG